jgi:catechol 2,3-dioxygenase-like lactoylglutathione lyase family enzyme
MNMATTIPTLDTIDHVAVSVTDIAQSVLWYTNNFRCNVLYQDETWAFLEFANVKFALVLPEQHPPHLAFTHPEAEKFGALRTHRDGSRSVYISDLSGNSIEIIAQ